MGLALNENPLQGSYVVDELTDLLEEAVLAELESISGRGGVLGAMETGYQRGKIQADSLLYEHGKHDGTIPIVGVNTFRNPDGDAVTDTVDLARSDDAEKQDQLRRVRAFQASHAQERDRVLSACRKSRSTEKTSSRSSMDAVRSCSLGQITDALFEVGGRYRRNV